jgi:hypothetical protein
MELQWLGFGGQVSIQLDLGSVGKDVMEKRLQGDPFVSG